MRFVIILAAFVLSGCAVAPKPQPVAVTVQGPVFAATRFNCGQRPLPPNPVKVQQSAASAAALYENRLGTWGQHCSNQLNAVGTELRAAGQMAE